MNCPKCKLACPSDTARCECGHIFKSNPPGYNNPHYKEPVVHASPPQEVIVKGVDISFWNMIVFMVKWSLAAVPAMIILAVIYFIITALISGGLGAVFSLTQK